MSKRNELIETQANVQHTTIEWDIFHDHSYNWHMCEIMVVPISLLRLLLVLHFPDCSCTLFVRSIVAFRCARRMQCKTKRGKNATNFVLLFWFMILTGSNADAQHTHTHTHDIISPSVLFCFSYANSNGFSKNWTKKKEIQEWTEAQWTEKDLLNANSLSIFFFQSWFWFMSLEIRFVLMANIE